MNQHILSILPILVSSLIVSGCSISESSSNSSKSVFDLTSSPLTSSSDSSASEQEKFENDVADYTAEFVTSSKGTMDQFREHLTEIANSHGITDWENDLNTFRGIGRGLKKAKATVPVASAFTESMSGDDRLKQQAIEDGMK